MRKAVLWLVLIIPGVIGVAVFGWFSLVDFAILQDAYKYFVQIAHASPTETQLFVAHAEQNIHRINLAADGIWTLLCAIYAAIGVHGLCLLPPAARREADARSSVAQN